MSTQLVKLFIPQTGDTPARYETFTYDPNPIIIDRNDANKRMEDQRKKQERIARNDAKWAKHLQDCARWHQDLDAYMAQAQDNNPMQAQARLSMRIRLNPPPKPPKLT